MKWWISFEIIYDCQIRHKIDGRLMFSISNLVSVYLVDDILTNAIEPESLNHCVQIGDK